MSKLVDNFGRQIAYVRLAVTDRCNLRCQYCMPAHGIAIVPKQELLSFKRNVSFDSGVNRIGYPESAFNGWESLLYVKILLGF